MVSTKERPFLGRGVAFSVICRPLPFANVRIRAERENGSQRVSVFQMDAASPDWPTRVTRTNPLSLGPD